MPREKLTTSFKLYAQERNYLREQGAGCITTGLRLVMKSSGFVFNYANRDSYYSKPEVDDMIENAVNSALLKAQIGRKL